MDQEKNSDLEELNNGEDDSINIDDVINNNLGIEVEEGEEVYDVLFAEDDKFFDGLDSIEEEDVYHDKEYFAPKSSVLSDDDKNRLAEENMSLVQYIVKRFGNTGIDYEELFSVALMGYVKAINSYNPTRVTKQGKPIKFSTFAYRCIENEIFYFIRNDKKIKEKQVSLQTTLSTDKNGNTLDLNSTLSTESEGEPSLEDTVSRKETVMVLRKVIEEELTPKEQFIIKHRFGIDADNKTQNEIAQETNMSQANISKLEKNIMDKIKKIMIAKYKIKDIDF